MPELQGPLAGRRGLLRLRLLDWPGPPPERCAREYVVRRRQKLSKEAVIAGSIVLRDPRYSEAAKRAARAMFRPRRRGSDA